MRRVALGLVGLALVAVGWWWWRTPYRLPPRMAIETVADDLSGRFVPTPPIRTAGLLPRPQTYPGAFRHAWPTSAASQGLRSAGARSTCQGRNATAATPAAGSTRASSRITRRCRRGVRGRNA